MRALIQRVDRAGVRVGGRVTGEIGVGLLVFLGVEGGDTVEDVEWLAGKVVRMRIFGDDEGQMNRSVVDVGGGVLVVSQFTLHASTRKGNRPSFVRAARPEVAEPLYREFVSRVGILAGCEVATGEFGAMMSVDLVNAGPVTIWVDSRARE